MNWFEVKQFKFKPSKSPKRTFSFLSGEFVIVFVCSRDICWENIQPEGGDFSVGHIVLDFDLKLLLCWTNAFGHTLLGSFVYVVICWAVEDTLCWAVGHWASVALCWAVIIICTLLGSFYCMESVGHVQQSYW